MSKKRIPCPYCDELILPKAKKCRYCKEELDKKNNKSFKFLYLSWFATLFVFFVFTFAIRRVDAFKWIWGLIISLLLITIFTGIAFFVTLTRKILKHLKTKRGWIYGLISIVTFFFFFVLLINFDTVEAKLGFSPPKFKNEIRKTSLPPSPKPSPSVTPSSFPKKTQNPATKNTTSSSNSNQVECIGPDDKIFKTSMEECKNLNEKWGKSVNYMLTCHFPQECGGGSKYMAKSECDKPCTPTNPVNTTTNNAPSKPSNSADYFCVNNVTKESYYTTSGEQCNADNLISSCLDRYKKIYDLCMDDCLFDANSQGSYCIYNLSGVAQDECLAENDKTHQSCMNFCSEERAVDTEFCY